MSIRIEIELTSSAPDGSWTWRAAGAREPRGVLDGSILPAGRRGRRHAAGRDGEGHRRHPRAVGRPRQGEGGPLRRAQLLPSDKPFEPVIQQRVTRDRDDGRPRRRGRDGPGGGDRRDRHDRGRADRGPRRDGEPVERPGGDRPGGGGGRGAPRATGDRGRRRHGATAAATTGAVSGPTSRRRPRCPQRPKPKRLRPGKQHRTEVLESLPEEQRPIAELALQGIAAVRQRLREDNVRLQGRGQAGDAGGRPCCGWPRSCIPRLRVADWLDRADAAQRQLEHLDLRDLRSVVAASDDPVGRPRRVDPRAGRRR